MRFKETLRKSIEFATLPLFGAIQIDFLRGFGHHLKTTSTGRNGEVATLNPDTTQIYIPTGVTATFIVGYYKYSASDFRGKSERNKPPAANIRAFNI